MFMKKIMNKNLFTSLCLASLIALLPACGCGKEETGCQGGVCPVASQQAPAPMPAPTDETNKTVDAQDAVVCENPEEANVDKF
jgi:hypothetical protein